MPSENSALHAPWRLDYLRSLETPDTGGPSCGCFLCDAAATPAADRDVRKKRLVLWDTPHCVCVINRYPYTSGHLLVAPRAHKAELADFTDEELFDLNKQTVRAVELIRRLMNPQGFNVGINMGKVAGAGLPGHLHQHVIARWGGDVNFISVVGNVRIVPHANDVLWDELTALLEGGA